MFSSAEAELNAFKDFDAPDLYYQFYPDLYQGKKGRYILAKADFQIAANFKERKVIMHQN